MKFRIMSNRGDHQATIEAPEVAEAIFNKLTGKTTEALPVALKTQVPDTFQELETLWTEGKGNYTVFAGKDGDLEIVRDFQPEVETVVFMPQIAGG